MNAWLSLSVPWKAEVFALQVAICGAVVSGLALAAAWLARHRSPPLRYAVLFGGVLGLLAIPALVGVGQCFQGAFVSANAPVEEEVVTIPLGMAPELFDPSAPASPLAHDNASSELGKLASSVLLAAWALVAAFGLVRLLHGMCKQRRAIVGITWHADWWTKERQACLAGQVGLRTFPAVRLSPAAPMPMVLGLKRPTIVLPEAAPASWGQPQWEAVLLHEAAHIARRDPWAVLAQRCAVLLFWWCPLVHLLARRLNDLREAICDDYALEGPCDRLAYAELLVESAERLVNLNAIPVPLALLDSARGGLEARITRLLEKEKQPMTKFSLAGKLLGAVFLVAVCMSITAATALSGGQPPAEKKIKIKILVDGKEIELNDLQLHWEIEKDQKKAKPKPAPGLPPGAPAGAAVSDQKLLEFLLQQAGKIDQAHPATPAAQAKPDPRIEELVKAAEAIKPGSGAEIRRALQVAPKATKGGAGIPMRIHTDRAIAAFRIVGQERASEVAGAKQVVILAIENGKVTQIQITPGELKKLLEKGAPVVGSTHQMILTLPKAENTKKPAQGGIPFYFNIPIERKSDAKPTPAPDVEALRRQLERLSVEVDMLRQRLEKSKKEGK